MAVTEAPDTKAPARAAGIRPSQVILAIGVALALVVGASGIFATLMGWHDESPVTREVFENVPSAFKAIFYTVLSLLFVGVAYLASQRAQNWERGRPDRRATTARNAKKRVEAYRAGVYMQTLLRDGAAGLMHSLIYFPFLILFAVTTILEINHQLPESAKFLHGDVYRAYSLVGDLAGVLFLVGIVWAIVRRYIQRPYRLKLKTRADHHIVLSTFLVLGVTGFLAEGARIAIDGRPDFEKFSIVGYPLSSLFEDLDSLHGVHQIFWVAHVLAFFAFLVLIPTTQLRHM
ncbi:MAG TPA: respiratory nitrate reductase subunit gamma, partial [Acidimicrobiales bacterium]|nr:respiratory nitrate reductase subunit gamma [Acidimicrobiales bacterium]